MNSLAFQATGLALMDRYLSAAECRELRASIDAFRAVHDLRLIHRQERGRSLRYFVMDGDAIRRSCPALVDLYRQVGEVTRKSAGSGLVPMSNATANLNVNITPPGGEYRWHYDRNRVTAILYLNSVAGGEIEIYPNYRIHLGRWRATRLQRVLDRLLKLSAVRRIFGKRTIVSPREGLLVIMRGDRSLHSVRQVEGVLERINVVMSFDVPEGSSAPLKNLDGYLYSSEPVPSADPNYGK